MTNLIFTLLIVFHNGGGAGRYETPVVASHFRSYSQCKAQAARFTYGEATAYCIPGDGHV